MHLINTPCAVLRAGDRLDLAMNSSCFYNVLSVRPLPNNKMEILVVANPLETEHGIWTFEPKYIVRNESDIETRLEESES